MSEVDISEIIDGFRKPLTKWDFRFPSEVFSCELDDRLALGRVICGKRFENKFGAGADHFDRHLGELADGEFTGVSEVDGPVEVVGSVHHSDNAFNEIIDVAE